LFTTKGCAWHSTLEGVKIDIEHLSTCDRDMVVLVYPEMLGDETVLAVWEELRAPSQWSSVNLLKSVVSRSHRDLGWKRRVSRELIKMARRAASTLLRRSQEAALQLERLRKERREVALSVMRGDVLPDCLAKMDKRILSKLSLAVKAPIMMKPEIEEHACEVPKKKKKKKKMEGFKVSDSMRESTPVFVPRGGPDGAPRVAMGIPSCLWASAGVSKPISAPDGSVVDEFLRETVAEELCEEEEKSEIVDGPPPCSKWDMLLASILDRRHNEEADDDFHSMAEQHVAIEELWLEEFGALPAE
jgi:hypothetical protein